MEGPRPIETGVKETTVHHFKWPKKHSIYDPVGLQRSPQRHAIKGEIKENQDCSTDNILSTLLLTGWE